MYQLISGKGVKYRLLSQAIYNTGITDKSGSELNLVRLTANGVLIISPGYEWNGPNVILDTDKAMRASLVHDALCELLAEGRLKKEHVPRINDIFRDICKEDGMSSVRYNLYRWGLKKYWQGLFG